MDIFDLICYVAYGRPPLTRKERVENIKKRDYFTKYEGKARDVIEKLLEKYAEDLKEAGLTRVNISLDTMDENKYRSITRGGELVQVPCCLRTFYSKASFKTAIALSSCS